MGGRTGALARKPLKDLEGFPPLIGRAPTDARLSDALDSPDIEEMLINGLIQEGEDGNSEPGELEESDDEEEPVPPHVAERVRLAEVHKAEYEEYMAKPVSHECPRPAGPGGIPGTLMRQDELQTEENGQGDQASTVPLASVLKMAAAETPPDSNDEGDLAPLDTKLASMSKDINARCKELLETNGGVPTSATLNLFEELVNDSNALLAAMETEIETEVAADSGAVDHVAGPDDIPGCVEVKRTRVRNFVGPTGKPIEHHGEALVHLVNETGRVIGSVFQIANVVRPLHSVSKICDEKHEMLFTATEATVVPAGTLSKFLASIKGTVKYHRNGGLYVTKVKVRAPGTSASSSFTRPGVSR